MAIYLVIAPSCSFCTTRHLNARYTQVTSRLRISTGYQQAAVRVGNWTFQRSFRVVHACSACIQLRIYIYAVYALSLCPILQSRLLSYPGSFSSVLIRSASVLCVIYYIGSPSSHSNRNTASYSPSYLPSDLHFFNSSTSCPRDLTHLASLSSASPLTS